MSSTAVPNPPTRLLTSFSVLTLDIYGTLIDWELSVFEFLRPILSRLPYSHPLNASSDTEEGKITAAKALLAVETEIQREKPHLKYDTLLTEVYLRFAQELGVASGGDGDFAINLQQEAKTFGASVGSWIPFPDTIDAMNRLHKHFKLVPLSNVDIGSFRRACEGPLKGISPGFDAVYTAEDIGSYKPSLKNFDYLLEHLQKDFGFAEDQVLHTAQSLMHDHIPAKQMGLTSAWIARRYYDKGGLASGVEDMIQDGKVGFSWKFRSLGEMADAVERENALKEVNRNLDG
ncbi:haloacid dehalogenase-like hydrolase family protein [Ilyonectria destructans]|nr:haloacid dehalogenase-like hydrolase family protein [Ilyonectria destructans]